MRRDTADHAPDFVTVFAAGMEGIHTYRIPAIVATGSAMLLAFCEARHDSSADQGDIDIVLRRSRDNGATWDDVRVVVEGRGNTAGNPVPIMVRETGSVVLLFCTNDATHTEERIMQGDDPPRSVWRTESLDEGVTWSRPVEISDEVRPAGWRWYSTGPCHGIQLATGRLVAPCCHTTGPDDEELHSHVVYSDDLGSSWHVGGELEGRTNESVVAELEDGSLYINSRTYRRNKLRVTARSVDGGRTWSPVAEECALIEPQCQGCVLRVRAGAGDYILFSNPASHQRVNLTVRLSCDSARTWPVSKTLWPGPAAYSDLVELHNGDVGCLFECGEKGPYETITFARASLAWLTNQPGEAR